MRKLQKSTESKMQEMKSAQMAHNVVVISVNCIEQASAKG
jgi:hypothetical protein